MRFYKSVADTVYGRIDVTEPEFELLQSPLLQRLRHISQTAAVCLVFPGASHNRFSHSLGCLYMIDKMARAMDLSERDIQWLRCAALLHDVGHYPLSHTGETVYGNTEQTATTAFENDVETEEDAFVWAAQCESSPSHERMSSLAILQNPSLRRLLEDQSLPIQHIADVIQGNVTGRPDAALFNFLMNSQLDADKMDYLVRDATLVGAKYGLIDADYLLKSLTRKEDGGTTQPAIALQGLHSLEHALLSRYFMYCNVICHRTVVAFDILIRAVFRLLLSEGIATMPVSISQYEHMIETDDQSVLAFSDNAFWSATQQAAGSGSARLSRLSRMLLHRNGPKCAYQTERCIKNASDELQWQELQLLRTTLRDPKKRQELAESADVPPEDIALCETRILLTKGDESAIKVLDAEAGLLGISEIKSSVLASHVDEHLRRASVYVIEDPPSRKADGRSPRNRVRDAIHELLAKG